MRRPTLEQLTNIVIIVTCISALTMLTVRHARRDGSSNSAAMFTVGQRGPELQGIKYGDQPKTLVMYLRSSCGYCTESMPFYRALTGIRKSTSGLRLVVASIDPVDVSKEYLQAHKVEVDSVVVTTPRGIPTPTLVLVDQSGAVRDVWVGKQPIDRERNILQTLKQGLVQARSNVDGGY